MSETKKITTKNTVQVCGTLAEINMEKRKVEKAKIKNWTTGKEKEVDCEVIAKKDMRQPSMLIDCKNENGKTIVPVHMRDVYSVVLDDNGNIQDNSQFKARETIMQTYVTKAQATEEKPATRVYVEYATLQPNEYVSREFEYKIYSPNVQTYNVTSSNTPDEDIFEGIATGIVSKITPETKGSEGEETGRVKVEVYMFAGGDDKRTFPVTFIAEEDLADDIENEFKKGDNVKISFDLLRKHVGGTKQTTAGKVGRGRTSNIVNGFDVDELSIFDMDIIEEDMQGYIDLETFKKYKTERDVNIEKAIDKKKNDGEKSKNPLASKKPSASVGKRKSKVQEDEAPFDTDDVKDDSDDDFDEFF